MQSKEISVNDLVRLAREQGLRLSTDGQSLQLRTDAQNAPDGQFVESLRARKKDIIRLLQTETVLQDEGPELAPRDPLLQALPASFAQERLWLVDSFEGSVAYHVPTVLRLHGPLNAPAFEEALRLIVDRHEVLRTTLVEEDGVLLQRVGERGQWRMDSWEGDKSPSLADMEAYVARPFDLSRDPMLRVLFARVSDNEHLAVTVVHHIASDGWSRSVLVRELKELYAWLNAGIGDALPPLRIQYADYALWQRGRLAGRELDRLTDYWKTQLENVQPLELPLDRPRPAARSGKGSTCSFLVDGETTRSLKELAGSERLTLYMVLLSGFQILLNRYSGQRDICIGLPVAHRIHSDLEEMIGFFVNTLALRQDVDPEQTLSAHFASVRERLTEAYRHQDLPFEKVVELAGGERDASINPLFQVLFVLQNQPEVPELALGPVRMQVEEFEHHTSKFDLTFDLRPEGDCLRLRVEYDTELFHAATIERMAGHFQTLLRQLPVSLTMPVGHIGMMDENEFQRTVVLPNQTLRSYAPGAVIDLFERQAALQPDAVALTFEGAEMTYAQLNGYSNAIALLLRDKGIGANDLVPVCLRRSFDLIAAIVGVLKAGAAYVPIDPAYPAERIALMLDDVNASLILCDEDSSAVLPPAGNRIMVSSLIGNIEADVLRAGLPADRLTYVIYTSGSTGRPKGILMPDTALYNLLQWQAETIRHIDQQRILQFASINFDASFQEIFLALGYGGRLCLIDEAGRRDMPQLFDVLQREAVTHLFIPYVVLQNICAYASDQGCYPPSVREIFTAGEQLKLSDDIGSFLSRTGALLYNYYGPSETHVVTSYEVCETDFTTRILPPIGLPIANTTTYILDAFRQPCCIGQTGELYLGGVQVAKGYLNRPELTAERFSPDTFAPGGTLYRTGDLCRWLSDGQIEFLGRGDDQVKVRGYRVELGEVEAVLAQAPGIRQCVVVAAPDAQGGKQLLAYCAGQDIVQENVYDHLRLQLPAFMIPAQLIVIPHIPYTNNGKVDRKKLPAPDLGSLRAERTLPATTQESLLAAIWQQLLKLDEVGTNENFFRLGGHSLLVTRLLSQVRKQFGITVSVRSFFQSPTIVFLARQIEAGTIVDAPAVQPADRPEYLPLSFAQERFWFIDQLEGSQHYHLAVAVRIRGAFSPEALTQAFRRLVERHEVLRTCYLMRDDGQVFQRVLGADRFSTSTLEAQGADVLPAVAGFCNEAFHLDTDLPIRVAYVFDRPGETVLAMAIHHIAADGWSLDVLFRELSDAYAAEAGGAMLDWSAPPYQYADYAIAQRAYWTPERIHSEQQYWKENLAGDMAPVRLTPDHSGVNLTDDSGRVAAIRIDGPEAAQLLRFSQSVAISPFASLLAAFYVLLYRYTGQTDCTVGTSLANRTEKAWESAVGLFLNTVVLRAEVRPDEGFDSLSARVAQMLSEAIEHGGLPFEKVVEAAGAARLLDRNPLFQIMFEQSVAPDPAIFRLGEAAVEMLTLPQRRAKFDLLWAVHADADHIEVTVEYDSALFAPETIQRMMQAYRSLLTELIAAPMRSVLGTDWLLPGERELLDSFQPKPGIYPERETILSLWRQRVALHPAAVAVIEKGRQVDYAQLHARACAIALQLDCEPGELVPIAMQRGVDLIASILAVWMRGAAYVALDPELPLLRLRHLLTDTAARYLIADESFAHAETLDGGLSILLSHHIPQAAASEDFSGAAPQDLAYVLYTSGSTGQPKGAMVEHAGMLNHLYSKIRELGIDDNARVAQTASFTFDISVWQMFSALVTGGTTIIYAQEELLRTDEFLAQLAGDSITILELVPSYLNALLEEPRRSLPALQHLLVTGEAVLPATLIAWFDRYPDVPVVNAYGPTEASDDITHHYMTEAPAGPVVPIGRPIQNMHIYIVNTAGKLCPPGIIGEIWVAGIGVGRGYWNDEERTAAVFGKDPFRERDVRLYRTGDLGRWRWDGVIEFFGRKDEQVKVNGHRIELGEIENALLQIDGVRQAAVVLAANGHKGLRAFVCTDREINMLQAALSERLPQYLLPQSIERIAIMPVLSSGKVDRRALQQLPALAAQAEDSAPLTQLEMVLADIWKDLLHLPKVGAHDNFFSLGGDSILAIQLVIRARRNGLSLQLRDIFEYQTISGLAQHARTGSLSAGPQDSAEGLLPVQNFFFEQDLAEPSYYNQAVLLEVDKTLEPERLHRSWAELTSRHAALRTRFVQRDGVWFPEVTAEPQPMEEKTLAANSGDLAEAIENIARSVQASLDLAAGPLYRAVLLLTPEESTHHRLLLVAHHLIIDGVSWRVLLEEMHQFLSADGPAAPVAASATPAQWRHALQAWVTDRFDSADWKIWNDRLALVQELPPDEFAFGDPHKPTDMVTQFFGAAETALLLREANDPYKTDVQDLLLAALHQSLASWSGQQSLLFYLESHGREQAGIDVDISQSVGWFTSIFPAVLTAPQDADPRSWIVETKEQLRSLPFRGTAYGALRYLHPDESVRKATDLPAAPGLMFNYLGQTDRTMSGSRWFGLASEPIGPTSAEANRLPAPLVINASVVDQQLCLKWHFDTGRFSRITIDGLMHHFTTSLRALLEHCRVAAPMRTPSDFGLGRQMSWHELHDYFTALETSGERVPVDLYALSPLQSGMLFHGLYDRDSKAYMLQLSCRLQNFEVEPFIVAWQDMIRRHTALRTGFLHGRFSTPVQLVYAHAEMPVRLLDWRNEPDPDSTFASYQEEDFSVSFDFDRPPLMRLALMRTGEKTYRMLWTFHHLTTDGWGLPVQVRNLFEAYEARLNGGQAPVVPEDRYRDYIRYISNHDKGKAERFWRAYLGGLESGSLLPFVSATISRNKGAGQYRVSEFHFSTGVSERLQAFARQHRLTPNTIVQGVWAYLLSRYTSRADVVFGVTVSGRPFDLAEAQSRVGLYINTLPLRAQVSPLQTVAAFLHSVQQHQAQAREFQYTPLSTIQSWQGIRGDLFDSILVFQNYPVDKALLEQSLIGVDDIAVREQTNYVLSLIAVLDGHLRISFKYNSALLDEEYVQLMQRHFEQVLPQFLEEDRMLSAVELMDEAETRQLTENWSGMLQPTYPFLSVTARLEEQARAQPQEPAIRHRQETWTYGELNQRANRLAHYLIRKGIGPGGRVPLFLSRSADAVCCMLAVLKTGAAYVPLDPESPAARTAFVLQELDAGLILTDSASLLRLSAEYQLRAIDVQDQGRLWADASDANPQTVARPNDPAYLIYTSGSTGEPKGAVVSFSALGNYLAAAEANYTGRQAGAKTFLHLALTFDAAVTSVFLPLIRGSLLVVGALTGIDVFRDKNFLDFAPYDFIKLTPAHLSLLAPLLEGRTEPVAELLVIGGEALQEQQVRAIAPHLGRTAIVNEYGPTEATVGCCISRFEPASTYRHENGQIPIGRPLNGNTLFVLDANGRPVPAGVPGELYIGGAQLAEGYWHRDALTEERFIHLAHIARGERLYRTGDLCRWLPGGLLLFEGRTDGQVKLHGHRIELHEVETTLRRAPGVREAAVVIKGEMPNSRRLVAYYTSDEGLPAEQLARWLREQLPDYMVPSLLVQRTELPITPHGKVDLRTLTLNEGPELLQTGSETTSGNAVEAHLIDVFETLLEIRGLSPRDNLFNVGLDSLKTIEAQGMLNKYYPDKIQIHDLFTHNTVEMITALVTGPHAETAAELIDF